MAHPIPTDLEGVKVLDAGVLDLFVWLSCRCFTAQASEDIPIFGNYGLVRQPGCIDDSRPRRSVAISNTGLHRPAVWP